jgi:hypothetical protein
MPTSSDHDGARRSTKTTTTSFDRAPFPLPTIAFSKSNKIMRSFRISGMLMLLTGVVSFQAQPVLETFRARSSSLFAVELEAEPEGGEELTPFTSLPSCRMKKMEELKVDTELGTPYQFWMEAEVDGTLIKQIRTQILKDASKQANFPGFRKVRVS